MRQFFTWFQAPPAPRADWACVIDGDDVYPVAMSRLIATDEVVAENLTHVEAADLAREIAGATELAALL